MKYAKLFQKPFFKTPTSGFFCGRTNYRKTYNFLTQSLVFSFIFISTYEKKPKETAPEEKDLEKELEKKTAYEIKKVDSKGKIDVTAGL